MNTLLISLRTLIWLSLLLGGIYPLVVTGVSYLFMYDNAHGSLVIHDGKIRGSRLIGQKFSSDIYFWSRPSANEYNPLQSGGSNLSPASLSLKKLIEQRASGIGVDHYPKELLFASGSGLDPHISLETAYFQIDRIMKRRNIDSKEALKKMIDEIAGMNYVNVLELNMALDEKFEVK
jgi:K+-transporting ATPase ATPase C chain